MTYSDDKAIKALKNGIEEADKAFTMIYRKYFHRLCLFAVRFTGCMATAECIVQDIFAYLWDNREEMDIYETLNAYLHGSVRNNCLKHLAHIQVRCKYQESLGDESKDSHDGDCPETVLIEKETANRIEEVINALPEQRRQIFTSWWKEGLKYDEIAGKFGISIGTVKAQINRAKTKLRESFEK